MCAPAQDPASTAPGSGQPEKQLSSEAKLKRVDEIFAGSGAVIVNTSRFNHGVSEIGPDRGSKRKPHSHTDGRAQGQGKRATKREDGMIDRRRDPDPGCACEWCGTAFKPRTNGGTAQRFCKPACRRAFDQASRAWVRRRLHARLLSVADLRDGPGTARALLPEGNQLPDVDK